MAEFQEGTLDTMMERLCSSISGFDPEWVTRCVPATEEQIRQLQDIFAECHYTVPAAYLYYLRRMGQNDGGLLETHGGREVNIGTVLKWLSDKDSSARKNIKNGLFLFSDHWADSGLYMNLSAAVDNPTVTNIQNTYVVESFEKYLFQMAFCMYESSFTYSESTSSSVCSHPEKNKKENCGTCPYYRDTVEERMDFINQMAESYGIKKAWFSDQAHFFCYNASYAFEINVGEGYSAHFYCDDNELWKQVRSLLGVFPNFFSYLSSFENERDGKESGDMYERCASFNRYGDLSKFITDLDLLQATGDGGVYISNEDNYDIAVYLETCYASFDEVKPFIVFLATQICELDNAVQRFHRKKRIKKNGRGYVSLPSPTGTYRIDYSQSMEDNPAPQEEKSDFILAYIYMEEKNQISFNYWCTTENSEFDVVFEYKENKFFMRSYGIIDNIPDNWEE